MPPKTTDGKVPAKRKGEKLESQKRKRSKLGPKYKNDDDSGLLEADWEKLVTSLPKEATDSKIFVNKDSWDSQNAKLLKISEKDAALLPTSVKRILSKIDVFFLLQKSIEAANSRDFDALSKATVLLRQISGMMAILEYKREDERFLYEEEEAKLLTDQNVVYTSMNFDEVNLWEDSDSAMWECHADVDVTWFGKDGHFIEAQLHQINGHDHGDSPEFENWLKLDYRVFLKELGTDKVIEVDITFDHEVDIKDGLKSEEVDDTYYWVKYIDSGKLKKISDWLNLGLDSKECATVLYCLAIQYQLRKSYIRQENPEEWNGQIISELERVKNKYLKVEKEWAKEVDYVATRIGVKLTLMNRIENAENLQENARDEIISLIMNAALKYRFLQDTLFNHPDTEYTKKSTAEVHHYGYTLSFSHGDKVVAKLLMEMTKEKTLKGDLAVRDDDDGYNRFKIEFPNEEAKKEISEAAMQKFINELQLKNVTVKDLTTAFISLKAFPKMDSA